MQIKTVGETELQMYTLASGSSGNCELLSYGESHVLVDAGISCRKITNRLEQLGLTLRQLRAIVVTHAHGDHVNGLNVLLKRCPLPVYATPEAGAELLQKVPSLAQRALLRLLPVGESVTLGEITARPFATPHDAPGSAGYLFSAGGKRAAVVTDLGYLAPNVLDALQEVDLALIEANYDTDWLRSGPYPRCLQERVLGRQGHLSNDACGELAIRLARSGAAALVLAHLSRENNTPQRARETVAHQLDQAGCAHVRLYVAPRDELSPAYCV